jgi:hypothetical protein
MVLQGIGGNRHCSQHLRKPPLENKKAAEERLSYSGIDLMVHHRGLKF